MNQEKSFVLPQQDLAGKTAVVTGATRGIGRSIALNLATRGADVIGTGSSAASMHHIESLCKEVTEIYRLSGQEAPRVIGLPANILSLESPGHVADAVQEHFGGKLNILVNNAAYDELRAMGQIDDEYVQRCLTGNIHNLVMTMENLFQRGYIQPYSRILNISSTSGRKIPYPEMYLGAATKAMMEALTRTWADILGQGANTEGTTVNTLLVGATATERLLDNAPDHIKNMALRVLDSGVPVLGPGGMGRAEDVADVAGLIVSEKARWITGGVVCANGGYVSTM